MQKHDIREHQIFLIPDNVRTFYQADKNDPWEYIWIHIGGPKIPLILKEAGLTSEHPVYTPLDNYKQIEGLAMDILKHYKRQYYCVGTLYKICDYMIENSASREEKKMAVKLLADESISINRIASSVGYSDTFTFSKAFKRHFGESPSDYRKTHKISSVAQAYD